MSIRPTGYPEWASRTPTGITEPTDAKKQAGWVPSEKPAAQYMNWFQDISSRWIRYLSYEWLINDDFLSPPGYGDTLAAAPEATGLLAGNAWGMTPISSGCIFYSHDPDFSANGVVQLQSAFLAPNPPVRLEKHIGPVGSRNFVFDALVRSRSPFTAGYSVRKTRIGLLWASNSGLAYFTATGSAASGGTGPGHWWFEWSPSLAGITGVDLGVTVTPSAYQRLFFERLGQTITVEINGQSRLAFYAGNMSMTGARGPLMIEPGGGASFTDQVLNIDLVKFGVRR